MKSITKTATSMAAALVLCLPLPVHAQTSVAVKASWESDYSQLRQKLGQKAVLAKTSASMARGAQALDKQALLWDSDNTPLDVQLRRTEALISHIKTLAGSPGLSSIESELQDIRTRRNTIGLPKLSSKAAAAQDIALYIELRALTRQVAFANPVFDFDEIILTSTAQGGHYVGGYQGWRARVGGGLYKATNLRTNPVILDILANSTVQNGRLKGQSLAGGAFQGPDLSYDGKTILFGWKAKKTSGNGGKPATYPQGWGADDCWHIFKVNVDGSDLVQLTDGGATKDQDPAITGFSDFDPCWLPNGRVVFISERGGGMGRCHNWLGFSFTLHSMKADGSDITRLSYHETNEWNPSVDNNGMIVYSRWDYVDRNDHVAHNFWITYPDGRNARAYHANYSSASSRPVHERDVRAIPGSHKYVLTANAGGGGPGQLILVDLRIPEDDKGSQMQLLSDADCAVWDEARNTKKKNVKRYATAWPLNETSYLVARKGRGIVLLDKFGNEEVLITPAMVQAVGGKNPPFSPIPLRSRPVPPAIPVQTWQGERADRADHAKAVISVMDVYNSGVPLPAGVKIKEMRVIQILPKTHYVPGDGDYEHMLKRWKERGYKGELTRYPGVLWHGDGRALARLSLGTVPVEEDGSVYMEAPVGKDLYFQLLDENGLAVQSMKAGTYVHPGEHLTCIGCHENKWEAPKMNSAPLALKRPPSKLKPEYGNTVEPQSFYTLAKPVLDSKCGRCHNAKVPPDLSHGSLRKYVWKDAGSGLTTPGKVGARASALFKYIDGSHKKTKLAAEEYRRLTLWMDMMGPHYGAYIGIEAQERGAIVWPRYDMDPSNPIGVEHDHPLPGTVSIRDDWPQWRGASRDGICQEKGLLKK